MVRTTQPAYHNGAQFGERGVQFFGVLSSIMIALALMYVPRPRWPPLCLALPCLTLLTPGTRSPQYYEIHKHRAVIGISVTFMFVDLLGGVFSDLSLAFKPKFDVIASVTYSVVIVRARAPFSPARLV